MEPERPARDGDGGMTLDDVRSAGLVYVGTAYTRYPYGIERAYTDACRITAALVKTGCKVFSPIAHGHGIAVHGGIDPYDFKMWLEFDAIMMERSDAIVIAKMESWEQSSGIAHEIDVFTKAGKPVFYLDPVTMEVSDRP